jgi:hypothetical protein
LDIYKAIGNQKQPIFNWSLPANGAKEMESIVGTIAKKFDLPPLDTKREIAWPPQSGSQLIFVVRRLSNNRRKDIWFSREDAVRLEMQDAIERLIAIANERMGPERNQDLRDFQRSLEVHNNKPKRS